MLLRILPLVGATLVLPDLYIYWAYVRKRCRRRLWHVLYLLPGVLLLAAALALSTDDTLSPANMAGLELFFTVYMLVALPKTLFMLCSLLGRGLSVLLPALAAPAEWVSTALAVAAFAALCYGTFRGPVRLRVRHVEFRHPDVPPAFDGYRIVQLSDFHLLSQQHRPEQVRRVVQTVTAQQPDMVVFTGDLVSIDAGELTPFEDELSRLAAPDGVFSVLGNHDYQTYARYLTRRQQAEHLDSLKEAQRRMGWQLLLNEHRLVRRGTDTLAVVGVENWGRPPFPSRGDLKKALRGLPEAVRFKVLLSHDPTHWRACVLPETDIPLTLAGHTHGMQFMLGGWSPSRYVYPEWRGLYREGRRALHVSLGLGGALIPFRLGAWPEINVITLRRDE